MGIWQLAVCPRKESARVLEHFPFWDILHEHQLQAANAGKGAQFHGTIPILQEDNKKLQDMGKIQDTWETSGFIPEMSTTGSTSVITSSLNASPLLLRCTTPFTHPKFSGFAIKGLMQNFIGQYGTKAMLYNMLVLLHDAGYYSTKDKSWTTMSSCPDFTKPWSPGLEDECAAFLNNIVLKVYSALPSTATASLRWWTAANSVCSVEDGSGRQRPDLVLMSASSDNPTNPKALPPANWRSVHALAELKDREKNSVPLHGQIFQLMGHASFLRAAQDRRLHILGFALCGASFTLLYIDQGVNIIVKDTWHDVHRLLTEGAILHLLEAKGVKGVPCLIGEEKVPVSKQWREGVDGHPLPQYNCTSNIQDSIETIEINAKERNMALADPYQPYQLRAHIRSTTTPAGALITDFNCLEELLVVTIDHITSHKMAYSSINYFSPVGNTFPVRILYRDGSTNWGFAAAIPKIKEGEFSQSNLSQFDKEDAVFDEGLFEVSSEEEDPARHDRKAKMLDTMLKRVAQQQSVIQQAQGSFANTSIHGHNVPGWEMEVARGTAHETFELLVGQGWAVDNGNHVLERTGTEPFMAVEIQNAQPGEPIQHAAHHDVESFYYIILAMCVLLEQPYQFKDKVFMEWEVIRKWLNPEFNTKYTHADAAHHKFTTFGKADNLCSFLDGHISTYFKFMTPYFERLRSTIFDSAMFIPERFIKLGPAPFLVLTPTTHNSILQIFHEALNQQEDNGEEASGLDMLIDDEYMEGAIGEVLQELQEDFFSFIPIAHSNINDDGENTAGSSLHQNSIVLNDNEDERMEVEHPTAGKLISMDETLHQRWRREFIAAGGDGEDVEMGEASDPKFFPFASEMDWRVAC
ncbi:hypothetical protein SERLADRAFT_404465 [Serpula lacrymans var. lacrymans S7.9]|uniref:Fungal-type protein kinase domain-containing protein n=1 Tax=Serpula lacrymans var. lacrymans (strain S7.9) TaxID=578457 RepID=F8ND88_SERL9|nr:uncharacterized protein SERLADRAFT_404465 [Serpula lacrymans var. lacrymans S7.9]EGO30172.1 hypothetical protein SERLADRAFT_404465 [Serpula lacrymans var. lacrymans S7.9]